MYETYVFVAFHDIFFIALHGKGPVKQKYKYNCRALLQFNILYDIT